MLFVYIHSCLGSKFDIRADEKDECKNEEFELTEPRLAIYIKSTNTLF